MEQIRTFVDSRQTGFCFSCDGLPDTRDHVPPRVLLDEPYPENLPVVGSCRACNEGSSLDEEYVACLLEVAACRSADPYTMKRTRIARKLTNNAPLLARLRKSLIGEGKLEPDHERVDRVIEKMGRGLCAYETGLTTGGMSARVEYAPIAALTPEDYELFKEVNSPQLIPEVGSRMMSRVLVAHGQPFLDYWQEVQPGRFSYAVEVFSDHTVVKMVVRDFLAARVVLADP